MNASIDENRSISLTQYLESLKKKGEPKALLLGNGLGLSYPNLEISSAFQFNVYEIIGRLQNFITEFQKKDLLEDGKIIKNPEIFLHIIRLAALEEILDHYIQKISLESTKTNAKKLKNFLAFYDSVFTINYDILTYKIFQPFFEPSSDKQFIDGFNGAWNVEDDKKLLCSKITDIESKIRNKENAFYFLHGRFHIYRKGNDEENYEYCKIKTNKDALNDYKNYLKKNIKKIRDLVIEGRKQEPDTISPLIVFEDRFWAKNYVINNDPYLRMCLDDLKKFNGELFIYGCSFTRDKHILEALKGSQINKIYISYLENRDENALKGLNDKDLTWVKIEDNEKSLIWNL